MADGETTHGECGGPMSEDESIESLDHPALKNAINEKFEGDEAVNILVFGKYKVGKSTLINSLFDREDEPNDTPKFEPTTEDVHCNTLELHGVKFNMYDTPGLQDGVRSDAHYLEMVRDKCPKLHLLIYCTKINEPLRPDDKEALENVRSTFTKDFWQNLVVAMTHADQVKPATRSISPDEHFKRTLEKKTNELREYFNELEDLYLLPTSTLVQLELPEINDWRVDFWLACVLAAKPGKEPKQNWKSRLLSYRTMNTVIVGTAVAGTVALLPFKAPLAICVGGAGLAVLGSKKAYEKYRGRGKTEDEMKKND